MGNVKHTPGPWTVETYDHVPGAADAQDIEDHREDLGLFKVTPYANGKTWGDVDAQLEANRRLIQAAPELLEALQTVMRILPDDQDKLMRLGLDSWIYEAKVAIEKATTGEYA